MPAHESITARCPRCGSFDLPPSRLRVAVEPGQTLGICGFTCPDCGWEVIRPIHRRGVALSRAAGARIFAGGPVPLELVEPHAGNAVTDEEVAGFAAELAAEAFPQEALVRY